MNADKEKWINEVFSSTRDLETVPVNPFLYERIMFRLKQMDTGKKNETVFLYKWAAVLVLLVAINGVTIANQLTHKQQGSGTQERALITELETQVSYNY